MVGIRSEKWSDERLEQVKALMFESYSMSEIGSKMGETRNAIIGIVTRNPDFFKGVPKLPGGKAGHKHHRAKRKLPSEPSRPPKLVVAEDPNDLKSMRKLDSFQARELNEPWKQAMRGDNLFFYWKMETEPTFIFRRIGGAGSNWRGHGVYAMTKGQIWAWVNSQRKT